MDRRTFLTWVGAGWLASSLPVALAACASTSTKDDNVSTTNSPTKPSEFKTIGTVAELDGKGEILNKQLAGSPVLVIRNPNNANTLAAVNPTCTHKGCTVAWKTDKKLFVCPCHDAEYTADGKVVKGPAKEALPVYEAKIEGDSVLVKVG
ncbi:MAG TPA: ubiquinol-cytochrome c reductase iron-sulfur subunit [Leptolyngbyaceae cyanobacterium]